MHCLFFSASFQRGKTSRHVAPSRLFIAFSWGDMAQNGYEKLSSTEGEGSAKVNPVLHAGWLSKITFWWMNTIFITGNKRPIEESDLFPLLEKDKSEVLTQRLEAAWEKELAKEKLGKRPRFWKALMHVCPWYEYAYIICLVMTDMANRMTLPVLLGFMISFLMGNSILAPGFEYVLALLICITSLGRNLAQHHYQNRSALLGMRFRAAATGILYKKVRFHKPTFSQPLTREMYK